MANRPPTSRTPEQIRASIEQNREELGSSLVNLNSAVTELTDWRSQVRRNSDKLTVGAAAAGFVLAGGISGVVGVMFGGRRKKRR
jgi:Protein of unknown function (DUF3618)